MEKEHKEIEERWADWLEGTGEPMEAADLQELGGIVQECNRALAGKKYPQPDADRAWRRFEETHVTSPRKRLRTFIWGGSVGAAACLLLVWLFGWNDTATVEKAAQPITVFAATSDPRGVTLSGSDGALWDLDNKQTEAVLGKQGIQVDKEAVDYRKTTGVEQQVLTVPRGRNFHAVLSDGTEVWLNAESRLSYPSRFEGKERMVELEGEAYFKVAADKVHPFIVRTSRLDTRVLGTEFNLKAYAEDKPCVTLASGSVTVRAAIGGKEEEVALRPGQELSLDAQNRMEVKEVDPYYCAQWKEGLFYFDRTSLAEILSELGRWYNIDIELECDRSVLGYHLHYVADKNEGLEESLAKLNALQKVKVTYKDNKIVVK